MIERGYALSVEDIESKVLELGPQVVEDSVLTGSAAIFTAMPDSARPPQDIDMVVSEGVLRHYRTQEDWQEIYSQDGRVFLSNGTYDFEFNPKVTALTGLQARSRQSPGGVHIASLQDVYTRKQLRNSDKDQRDTAVIRERLLDPERPPLAAALMQHEIDVMQSTLPSGAAYETPEAEAFIRLAANGLFCISTLYGDKRIGRVNQIIGSLELPEYQVAATYHNGFGLAEDAIHLQRQLDSLDVTPEQRMMAMAADMNSDVKYGNGRMKDNPYNYDELCSAEFLVAQAGHLLGPDAARDELLREMVLGTRYDEETHQQPGRISPNPLVRAVTGVDLHATLSGPGSVEAAFDIIVEDGMSARYSPERLLGRMLVAKGVRIGSVEEAMTFIDEYPTLKPYLIKRLDDSARFRHPHTGVELPFDWTLDKPALRMEHAKKLHSLANMLRADRISATGAYLIAKTYTVEMEEVLAA